MVTRFKDGTFVYPGALFRLTPEEQAAADRPHDRPGWVSPITGDGGDDGAGGEDDGAIEPETFDEADELNTDPGHTDDSDTAAFPLAAE
jgi:hypothetical protein